MPQPAETMVMEEAGQAEKIVIRIMAVVVLYKMLPAVSTALQTLRAAEHRLRSLPGADRVRLRILVADNTPGGQSAAAAGMSPPEVYRAFPGNPGLAPLYNLAIAEAEDEAWGWLLTLDQDSQLPVDFLASMADLAVRYEADEGIAAIVPRIVDGLRPVSPIRFVHGFPRIVGTGVSGPLGPHASAINSASLLKISALRRVGGYDERFPLNNSDTALFHRLDCAGYRLALAGDVVVQHEFAMLQREGRMTVERYRQLLQDERAFWDLYMSAMARAERLIRLMVRFFKSCLDGKNQAFRRATLEELRYRLFTSRTARIRDAAGLYAAHGSLP